MKKAGLIIPISLLLIVIFTIPFTTNAQGTQKSKRKEAKEAQKSLDYQVLGALLNTRKIIFETERVQYSTGAKIYNVVQVDGSRLYIRWEDPQNTSGPFTGVRDNTTPNISPTTGIFFEGDIKDWEITGNDNDYFYTLKLNILSRTGRPTGEIIMKAFSDKSAHIELRNAQGNMIVSNYTGYVRAF
jgi:hypothetical protein